MLHTMTYTKLHSYTTQTTYTSYVTYILYMTCITHTLEIIYITKLNNGKHY